MYQSAKCESDYFSYDASQLINTGIKLRVVYVHQPAFCWQMLNIKVINMPSAFPGSAETKSCLASVYLLQ